MTSKLTGLSLFIRTFSKVIAASSLAITGHASAATVSAFNTGIGNNGLKLTLGSLDPHWQVVAGPGVTVPASAVVVLNQHPSGQYFTSPDSLWISTTSAGTTAGNSTYTYQLTIDLTGYDPSSATLSGLWGVDDYGSILLNNASPIGTGKFTLSAADGSGVSFNVMHSFSITGGFVSGINTLQVLSTNASGLVGGPSGLNVGGLLGTAAPVPEPSLLAMFSVGAMLIISIQSRFRITNA